MIWHRIRRTPPVASRHAIEALASAHGDLKEAKQIRAEAREVGASLAHSQALNHFGLGLERAITGGPA